MNELRSKSSLSHARCRLIELMQRVNFGRIEGLLMRSGEPVLDPAPRVIRKLKIGAENGPRPEAVCGDFLLKHQAVELFEAIADVGEGAVLAIEIKHGLPFSVEIENRPELAEGGRHA